MNGAITFGLQLSSGGFCFLCLLVVHDHLGKHLLFLFSFAFDNLLLHFFRKKLQANGGTYFLLVLIKQDSVRTLSDDGAHQWAGLLWTSLN